MIDYLLDLLKFMALYGLLPFAMLYAISEFLTWFEKQVISLIGVYPFLFFAWFGVVVHELSHYITAKLFGHTILDMKLFHYNPQTGQLGYVNHAYQKKNIWHRFGNVFIGLSPLLMISTLLVVAGYYWQTTTIWSWQWWTLTYLLLQLILGMNLSRADWGNVWDGLGYYMAVIIVIHAMFYLKEFIL